VKKSALSYILITIVGLVDVFLQLSFYKSGLGNPNRGISFGVGQNIFPSYSYLFIVLGLVISLLFAKRLSVRWWLIIVGGSANGLVRMSLGYVWDYIHWNLGFQLWLNIADILISLGVVTLLLEFNNNKDE